jgi:hypothetical protein
MLGARHLADSKVNTNTWIYTPTFVSSTIPFSRYQFTNEYIWEKPKGINFVYGLVIGPGSGGGGGGTLGGGGGGSTGAMVQFLQPASLVPNRLLILVAKGGAGGAGGNPSGAIGGYPPGEHGIYYLSSAYTGVELPVNRKNYAKANQVHIGTQSGRGGTNAAAGAGGVIPATTFCPGPGTIGVSSFTLLAGNAGLNGGLTTAGTDASPATTGPYQGGAGGGGRSGGAKAGGNVLNYSALTHTTQTIWNQTLPGGAATGAPGANGITILEPMFYSTPGAGGGANDAGTGGRGGDGGIGCGGGGGGAGSSGGGAGGNGGDGIVILTCW